MSRPLVSIITPTWGRLDMLRETVFHVRRQTYPNIEHLVVFDGPDPGYSLTQTPSGAQVSWTGSPHLRRFSLGWRPTEELHNSFAVGALMMGALAARGEYQMWLCDDERMAEDHVEALVDLLEAENVDFVYPLVYLWKPGKPDSGYQVGVYPPLLGHITSVLYRRSCLDRGMYRFHMPREAEAELVPHDWDLIKRWLVNGATCAMLNRETLSHRVDH